MKYLKLFLTFSIFTYAEQIIDLPEKHFWYELEALYLQASEKSVVVTNRYEPLLTTQNFAEQKALHPHFNWDWGYRIGVGSFFLPPSWSAGLYWTNLRTSASQTKTTNTNDVANPNQVGSFPIWNIGEDILFNDYVSDSSLHWKLLLNLLDLNFSKTFRFQKISLRPFAGLRSGWIFQNFNIQYAGGLFTQTFITQGVTIQGVNTITMKNHYWGLGPRIGLSPSVFLGKGLSIYIDASVSALMGLFHTLQKSEYLEIVQFNKNSHPFGLRWIVDAAGGLAYQFSLFQNRYDFCCKLGYEFHEFFHQMNLQRDRFKIVPKNSNLSLQGASASVRMDF